MPVNLVFQIEQIVDDLVVANDSLFSTVQVALRRYRGMQAGRCLLMPRVQQYPVCGKMAMPVIPARKAEGGKGEKRVVANRGGGASHKGEGKGNGNDENKGKGKDKNGGGWECIRGRGGWKYGTGI